jgi:uncharacterized membrane protein
VKNDRPKISVPFETIDIIIEFISITIILLMWIHLFMKYNSLPDTVPIHLNAAGKPDDFSGKSFLWFLPLLATVMYFGLFLINRFPHLHNYMLNITKENALVQYRFSTRILRIVNFLCTLLFAYINYKIIIGAKSNTSELGRWFLITVIGVSVLFTRFCFNLSKKIEK